jgi:hypothetical protein
MSNFEQLSGHQSIWRINPENGFGNNQTLRASGKKKRICTTFVYRRVANCLFSMLCFLPLNKGVFSSKL